MRRTPLLASHRRVGAVLEERRGCLLPARFTSAEEEYAAAMRAGAVVDRSGAGRLVFRGKDVTDLLERLSTNHVDPLAPGEGVSTVLTTNKGRIVDVVTVTALAEGYLVVTGASMEWRVAEWIDGFTFREDAEAEDATRRTALIGVMGPKASRLLGNLSGRSVAAMKRWHNATLTIAGAEVVAIRTDAVGMAGYDLLVPRGRARGVWRALLERGRRYGITPLGFEAWDMLRVRNGVGETGPEYGEAYNPLEAGLLNLISFNKGCYVGQEVVARLNTYDKVQRTLVRLAFDGEPAAAGAPIFYEDREVGAVTSVARLPGEAHASALGYVRRAYADGGSRLTVGRDGDAVGATVAGG